MKKILLSAAAVLLWVVPCSAVVMTDTFDTIDRQFWDTHLYLSTLTADPVTDTGSVLRLRQGSVLSHDFGKNMYGSVSFDIFCPVSEPKQRVSLWAGPESLNAWTIGFSDPSVRNTFDAFYRSSTNDYAVQDAMLLDMTRWHSYQMIFDEAATSAYIDDILIGRSSYGGGFDTLHVGASIYASSGYIDNFRYSSTMDYPSAVPEPSSLIFLCLGLAGFIGKIVRRHPRGGALR